MNKMITFYECGQGDSAYISELNLLVDLGERKPTNAPSSATLDVMISHSHDDHILGMKLKDYKINQLIMPAYLPECFAIINKLKKRNPFSFQNLNNILLVYDGILLYDKRIKVLNPPLDPWNYWRKAEQITQEQLNTFLADNNFSIDEIKKDLPKIDYIEPNETLLLTDGSALVERNLDPFIDGMLKVITFYYNTYDKNLNKALNFFVINEANIFSIIFSYTNDEGLTYLFTGDANKAQFNRIIKEDKTALDCDVLKVPHHGSKNSLNQKIITNINPKIAIVSHNNGLFGSAKDPHPNKEILKLFKDDHIPLYSTNDVIKDNQVKLRKYRGIINGFNAEIK